MHYYKKFTNNNNFVRLAVCGQANFFYCIGKIDSLLDVSVFLTIFPYTTRLGFLGLSEQSEDMYFAVAPETSPAKCLSYFLNNCCKNFSLIFFMEQNSFFPILRFPFSSFPHISLLFVLLFSQVGLWLY